MADFDAGTVHSPLCLFSTSDSAKPLVFSFHNWRWCAWPRGVDVKTGLTGRHRSSPANELTSTRDEECHDACVYLAVYNYPSGHQAIVIKTVMPLLLKDGSESDMPRFQPISNTTGLTRLVFSLSRLIRYRVFTISFFLVSILSSRCWPQ